MLSVLSAVKTEAATGGDTMAESKKPHKRTPEELDKQISTRTKVSLLGTDHAQLLGLGPIKAYPPYHTEGAQTYVDFYLDKDAWVFYHNLLEDCKNNPTKTFPVIINNYNSLEEVIRTTTLLRCRVENLEIRFEKIPKFRMYIHFEDIEIIH